VSLRLFQQLPSDRQEAILNAGREEFLAVGYDLASTNRIVERAGISKGGLFKYFGSKEGFFLYICEREAERLATESERALNALPPDFFGALRHMAEVELRGRTAHPERYRLVEQLLRDPNHPVHRRALAPFMQQHQAVAAMLATALRQAPLRADLPFERVMNLVLWVSEGIKAQYYTGGRTIDPDQVLAELDQYLAILADGLRPR